MPASCIVLIVVVSPSDDWTTLLGAVAHGFVKTCTSCHADADEILSNGQLLRQRAKDKPTVFHRQQAFGLERRRCALTHSSWS